MQREGGSGLHLQCLALPWLAPAGLNRWTPIRLNRRRRIALTLGRAKSKGTIPIPSWAPRSIIIYGWWGSWWMDIVLYDLKVRLWASRENSSEDRASRSNVGARLRAEVPFQGIFFQGLSGKAGFPGAFLAVLNIFRSLMCGDFLLFFLQWRLGKIFLRVGKGSLLNRVPVLARLFHECIRFIFLCV